MSEMVWCNSCKVVVWADAHQPKVDLRGICNMLRLPCPKCGKLGNFDGWGTNYLTDIATEYLEKVTNTRVYDMWSAMKAIALTNNVSWQPSPDNSWFKRP